MRETSWFFEWKLMGKKVDFDVCEWRVHDHQEGRGGGTSMGVGHPLGAAPFLL